MVNRNACAFCKGRKRKCDKARPSCSNCIRLRKVCEYTEDYVQPHVVEVLHPKRSPQLRPKDFQFVNLLAGIDLSTHETLRESLVRHALPAIGSLGDMLSVSNDFFTGTHQRIASLSRSRFLRNLPSLGNEPGADFVTLCLGIILIQRMPSGRNTNVQTSLYVAVKNYINLLESASYLSLDLVQCRVLMSFYEMGHGLHTAAYISIAACARMARALGFHRTLRISSHGMADALIIEEQKRVWWAVMIMDRFITLCNGDALFVTDEPRTTDALPVDDLQWSESTTNADLEDLIADPPTLSTPFDTTVGQMARECQIAHLAGRVVHHVFYPIADSAFFDEEAAQLERTLGAYLPLLAAEELKIGKYCGGFGVCNSALFILYEFSLNQPFITCHERARILHAIEDTSLRALAFAEAAYCDREENYPLDILSPYLTYSLYQAAVVQHHLWQQHGHSQHKQNLETLQKILYEFTSRWMVAWQYLDRLSYLEDRPIASTSSPSSSSQWLPPGLGFPFQDVFVSTGLTHIAVPP